LVPHATKFGADYWWGGAFVKPFYPVTEAGAWGDLEPFVTDINLRDVAVLNAPDGYYYLSGTDMTLFPKSGMAPREKIGVQVWRSRDLKTWEDIGIVWKADDSPVTRAGLDKRIATGAFGPILYDIELHYLKGTYWIIGSMQTGRHWAEPNGSFPLVLRSRSGQIAGPYEYVWKEKPDCELWTPSLLEDDDGTVYMVGGGVGNRVVQLKDDLSGYASKIWEIQPAGAYSVGEGGHLLKIGKKYIHTSAVWHGADPYDKGVGPRGRWFSTYDLMYFTADNLKGPWSATRCAAPRCGNARPFQDKQGNWWAPFFGNHFLGPWVAKPGAYPLRVREENGDVFLSPAR
jgi:xylan 1,4-beta-xylosidase